MKRVFMENTLWVGFGDLGFQPAAWRNSLPVAQGDVVEMAGLVPDTPPSRLEFADLQKRVAELEMLVARMAEKSP